MRWAFRWIATALCFNLYRTLQAQGMGGDGNHSIIKALEAMAGIQARLQRDV